MRLLVTRPAADADKLARRLRALGHKVHCAPLIKINLFTHVDWPKAKPASFAITSANGVRALINLRQAFDARYQKKLHDIPVFAVGPTTALAAKRAGWRQITAAAGSVPALTQTIKDAYLDLPANQAMSEGATVWHISGDVMAGNLVAALTQLDIPARRLSLYEAEARTELPARIIKNYSTYDGVLIYSKRSADIFTTATRGLTHKPMVYCLSEPIAVALRALGYETHTASDATDRAMAALIGAA